MLKNTIAREYHRQSVGMYLLIGLAAFSFLKGEEHVQLATLFMSRAELLAIIVIAWGLHVLKTSLFFVKLMQQPSYEFLFDVALFPENKKWLELLKMQISLNIVFLSYAIFMLFIGIQQGQWLSVSILVVVNFVYILLPVLLKNKLLHHPASFNRKNAIFSISLPKIALAKWLFFPVFLLKKEPVYLLLQKLFAAVMITGIAYAYPSDDFDERLLKLGLFLVASGYFTLTQHFQSFYENNMLFSRNLPISVGSVFGGYIMNGIIFTLPELFLFISYLPEDVSLFVILDTYFYVLAAAVFWQVAAFWIDMQNANMNTFLFVGHAVLVIVLMFKVPLAILAVLLFFISFWQLRKHYCNFEAVNN
ncbi:MAG: hypothetical protein NWP83_03875 [Spirosomaceae bacterium]|nr:hypothetical protein [Spirosomataceae bacterium]